MLYFCTIVCLALKLQNLSDFYLAIFLFLMNNVGGNLPVIVAPIADLYDLRFALYIIWAGFVATSKYTYIFQTSYKIALFGEMR